MIHLILPILMTVKSPAAGESVNLQLFSLSLADVTETCPSTSATLPIAIVLPLNVVLTVICMVLNAS
jgi:hypothetical protein